MTENGLLKMKELAEASGVSAGTIKHYLREGLLPEPVKTSRNMAYYPPEFVERIRLIKQLQEERFMPLKVIRSMLDDDPERTRALVALEDRILERAVAGERARVSAAELRRRYDVPQEVLDRLAELEVLSPTSRGYGPRDVEIVEAIGRFRAGGYDERIGFTVYDTLRYKRALEELVKEEVRVLMDRLAGELDPDDAADLIAAGTEPLNELLAALHQKLLVAELRRQRAARGVIAYPGRRVAHGAPHLRLVAGQPQCHPGFVGRVVRGLDALWPRRHEAEARVELGWPGPHERVVVPSAISRPRRTSTSDPGTLARARPPSARATAVRRVERTTLNRRGEDPAVVLGDERESEARPPNREARRSGRLPRPERRFVTAGWHRDRRPSQRGYRDRHAPDAGGLAAPRLS